MHRSRADGENHSHSPDSIDKIARVRVCVRACSRARTTSRCDWEACLIWVSDGVSDEDEMKRAPESQSAKCSPSSPQHEWNHSAFNLIKRKKEKKPTHIHRSAHHRTHTYIGIGIIRLTHLLLRMLTVSPCPDLLHTMPPPILSPFRETAFAISHPPPFRYRARGSLLLLSAALHSLCALRIHDAKVRSANGFNGAPTASALPGNGRIRRCIKFTLQQPTKTLI